ncbi:MAG: UbiX family flavin prenyltransferase [Nitrososphaerota archaeon]
MRIVVGITGASGVVLGVRFLEVARKVAIETHTIVSPSAYETMVLETDMKPEYVRALASRLYGYRDMAASISSGSFMTDGMVVIPCSMKTLAGIAHGYDDNLIIRAAMVTLKERRRLVLVPRETPLNIMHIRNMLIVAKAGAVVLPAMPAFYPRPATVADIVDFLVGKVFDMFGVSHDLYKRWEGVNPE